MYTAKVLPCVLPLKSEHYPPHTYFTWTGLLLDNGILCSRIHHTHTQYTQVVVYMHCTHYNIQEAQSDILRAQHRSSEIFLNSNFKPPHLLAYSVPEKHLFGLLFKEFFTVQYAGTEKSLVTPFQVLIQYMQCCGSGTNQDPYSATLWIRIRVFQIRIRINIEKLKRRGKA